jgi:hypothetical protein
MGDWVRRSLRTMESGSDEFVAEVLAAARKGARALDREASIPLVEAMVEWARSGQVVGPAGDELAQVLALGSDLPEALGAGMPRHHGVPAATGTPDMPVNIAAGNCPAGPAGPAGPAAAAAAWRQQLVHTRAARALATMLHEGMEGVVLPGQDGRVAVNNAVLYGAGCICMCSGIGARGHVRRLAGALMAYMLFDHIGDDLDCGVSRRLVLGEMMAFWKRGSWSDRPAPVVRATLTPAIRRACGFARAWVVADRAGDTPDSAARLGEIARRVAADCARERAEPDKSEVGVDAGGAGGAGGSNGPDGPDGPDGADGADGPNGPGDPDGPDGPYCAALARSLRKNVPAVCFLLAAFLDAPTALTRETLKVAGRAAAFAQLFDDLLDRAADRARGQRTVVAGLPAAAYVRLVRAAGQSVGWIVDDVLGASWTVAAFARELGPERLACWSGCAGLLMQLMVVHRNRADLEDAPEGGALLDRVCRGGSPFDIGRAVRGWVVGVQRAADNLSGEEQAR